MSFMNPSTTTIDEAGDDADKKYLLSEESFCLLRTAQERIKQETDLIPSMRKLINALVNVEAVEALTNRLIESFICL